MKSFVQYRNARPPTFLPSILRTLHRMMHSVELANGALRASNHDTDMGAFVTSIKCPRMSLPIWKQIYSTCDEDTLHHHSKTLEFATILPLYL